MKFEKGLDSIKPKNERKNEKQTSDHQKNKYIKLGIVGLASIDFLLIASGLIYSVEKYNKKLNPVNGFDVNKHEEIQRIATIESFLVKNNSPNITSKETYVTPQEPGMPTNTITELPKETNVTGNITQTAPEVSALVAEKPVEGPKTEPKPEVIANPIISSSQAAETKPVATTKPAPAVNNSGCIQFPPYILNVMKQDNPNTPTDSAKKDGKTVCHLIAEGKKDKPGISSENPIGHKGSCCLDPDEIPNPKCCYPTGSVYEGVIANLIKNNPPAVVKENGNHLSFDFLKKKKKKK